MRYNTLHNPWLRVLACVAGQGLYALALKVFIVPLGFYAGGLMGFCQLLRTLAQTYLGMSFGTYDIAGVLYFLMNIPILWMAFHSLGRAFVFKTALCTIANSFFYSIIPSPAVPLVEDYLTACLLGGMIAGVGNGIILTCGASTGGLEIVGLCLSKRGNVPSVGKFSLFFNFFLYGTCFVLFEPEIAIYSIIYNFFYTNVLDRGHQQNILVQALIFTRGNEDAISKFIIEKLGRSVTYWDGVGGYTEEEVHVLCVFLSKFEIEELLRAVHEIDPHAFLTVQEGAHIHGNFRRNLN